MVLPLRIDSKNQNAIMESLFLFLLGCIFLWHSYNLIGKSIKSVSWPTTIGNISFCDLETIWWTENGPKYQVKVIYSYIVDGRQYENNTLAFGYMESRNKVQHETIFARLRNVESVRVSYDPDNPKSSVLCCGIHGSVKSRIVGGCGFLLFIISVFLHSIFSNSISAFFVLVVLFVSLIVYVLYECASERVMLRNLVTY